MKNTQAVKHILVIEPDPIQAGQVTTFLQSDTIHVVTAHTAQEAVAAADAQRPDAVVLELVLPAHNGVEFLHEFRSYAEWADVPVIIFSLQHIDDPSMLTSLGNVTYLYKPHTRLRELQQQLLDILG